MLLRAKEGRRGDGERSVFRREQKGDGRSVGEGTDILVVVLGDMAENEGWLLVVGC